MKQEGEYEWKIILFQGDSITDGSRGRDEDPNHILGHSYAYIAAAKLAYENPAYENPEKNLEFINKGNSGDTSADLYARWQRNALNLKPDYISILIGTNDISQEVLLYHFIAFSYFIDLVKSSCYNKIKISN